MREQPSVYILAIDDYRRIEMMIASLSRALETIFERRLVEPSICPSDAGDFEAIVDEVYRNYLF